MSSSASAEIVLPPALPSERRTSIPRRIGSGIAALFRNLFGFAALVLTLAVVSAIPILNLISLGYLLEASARVAKTGKLRSGFVGLAEFSRFGTIVLCCWLLFLPLRLVHSFWLDAELISPGSQPAVNLRIFLSILIVLTVLHIAWALIRGGRFRDFFWPAPIRFLRWLDESHDWTAPLSKAKTVFQKARPAHFFWLGARGFAGAAIWLALPLLILIATGNAKAEAVAVIGLLVGGILFGIAVMYVPFLQTRFAVTGNFRDFFSFRAARDLFRRAPLAFWLALFVTLLFALPLYLLKIELTPNELAWAANIIFVIFIFPARLILGWALSRADKRDEKRHWILRWTARLGAIPIVAAFVLLVWLTQYLSWHGTLSLLEQHAFLVPAPLLGL